MSLTMLSRICGLFVWCQCFEFWNSHCKLHAANYCTLFCGWQLVNAHHRMQLLLVLAQATMDGELVRAQSRLIMRVSWEPLRLEKDFVSISRVRHPCRRLFSTSSLLTLLLSAEDQFGNYRDFNPSTVVNSRVGYAKIHPQAATYLLPTHRVLVATG